MLFPKLKLNWIISHNTGKVLAAKLRAALKEAKDGNTRGELITILGGSGRSEGIPPLIDYVATDNPQRSRALLALENLASNLDLRKVAIRLLVERMGRDKAHGSEACAVLEQLANSPELQYEAGLASRRAYNPEAVKWAMAMLVKSKKQEAIQPLLKLLWRGETFADAEKALHELGATQAVMIEGYAAALSGPEFYAYLSAEKLEKLGDKRGREYFDRKKERHIKELLKDVAKFRPDDTNQSLAEKIGPERLLRIVEELGKSGDKRAIGPLLRLLNSESSVCERAEEALYELGASPEQIFERYMQISPSWSRDAIRHAARRLAEMGDKRALEPLLGALGTRSCVSVESALMKLGASKEQMIQGYLKVLEELSRSGRIGPPSSGMDDNPASNAIKKLEESGDQRAIAPILNLFGTALYYDAARALEKLGASREQLIGKYLENIGEFAERKLNELGASKQEIVTGYWQTLLTASPIELTNLTLMDPAIRLTELLDNWEDLKIDKEQFVKPFREILNGFSNHYEGSSYYKEKVQQYNIISNYIHAIDPSEGRFIFVEKSHREFHHWGSPSPFWGEVSDGWHKEPRRPGLDSK